MGFYEVLDQVVKRLQQQRRVTYRALQREFDLDDEFLEDVKAELIEAQQVARDENSRILVWIGPSASAAERSSDEGIHASRGDVATGVPTSEAERRQLTVMFCDLVGSTALSGQLDPEDLREVVRAYQETAAEVIRRFDGYIARYMGDGLLVYFGYPQAHEDDAQRAVRTGLDIVAALPELNARLQARLTLIQAHPLQVRIGIHSGLVVIEEIGEGLSREHQALGETPNIAARLEGLAQANTVVLSPQTRHLVEGRFDVEELGVHALKGVAEPMPIYAIRGESFAKSRFEAATVTGLTPLVGREAELSLLLQRWEQVKAGEGQVACLVGDAGIGKSRLIETLCERTSVESPTRLHYQCSPYYTNSAFYPIIAQLERMARFTRDDGPEQKLIKLEALLAQATAPAAEVAPLFAAMLAIPTHDRYPPLNMSPQRQKTKTIETVAEQFIGLAQQRPVLWILEDAHWCDPTSLEVLHQLIHRASAHRVFILITYRPELEIVWPAVSYMTTLSLARLSNVQSVEMIESMTSGKAFPQEIRDQIVAKTDGVPLFVEELTKTILESDLLQEIDDRYTLVTPLPPLAIPATLQDSLMARLDRLASVKEVAQIGAAIGREFSYDLMSRLSPLRDKELKDALRQLETSELLFRHGRPPEAQYRFKHALVRDTAYHSLLRRTRQQLHACIASVLQEQFPDTVAAEPELLAHHYTEAGLAQEAISYWRQAGQFAFERSAYQESIQHLQQGVRLLDSLPEEQARMQAEVELQALLGLNFALTSGYASSETERAYTKAYSLCEIIGTVPQLFPILYGLFVFYGMRGEHESACIMSHKLASIAQSSGHIEFQLIAENSLATVLWHTGDTASAAEHTHNAISLYNEKLHGHLANLFGWDFGVLSHIYLGFIQAFRGYPDTAVKAYDTAKNLAYRIHHPLSLCAVLSLGLSPLVVSHADLDIILQHSEECINISQEHGFPHWMGFAMMYKGWALGQKGFKGESISLIQEGLSIWKAIGIGCTISWFLALLAETYLTHDEPEKGLMVANEAMETFRILPENQFRSLVLYQRGQALFMLNRLDEAEACLYQSISEAQQHESKWWEFRSTFDLAKLYLNKGDQDQARNLLMPVYEWFTEGLDTPILQEAKAFLEAVS